MYLLEDHCVANVMFVMVNPVGDWAAAVHFESRIFSDSVFYAVQITLHKHVAGFLAHKLQNLLKL